MKKVLLLLTHVGAVALGFALGIYSLRLLIAPAARSTTFVVWCESFSQFITAAKYR